MLPSTRHVLPLVVVTLFWAIGCRSSSREFYPFEYELRVPATVTLPQDARVEFVTPSTILIDPLRRNAMPAEPGYAQFALSHFLYRGDKRRAVVVGSRQQPDQVFVLAIPRNPKPHDWTDWRSPDYIEPRTGDMSGSWTFMHKLPAERSKEIGANAFEMRYRILPLTNDEEYFGDRREKVTHRKNKSATRNP